MTQPDPGSGAPVTHFAYNADGMLTSVTDAAGNTTSFVYDGADCVRQIVYADGTHIQLDPSDEEALPAAYSGTGTSADPFPVLYAGRPSSTDAVNMASPGILGGRDGRLTDQNGNLYRFSTDRFGNLTELEDPLGNVTQYQRDADGDVTEEIDNATGTGSTAPRTTMYTYDSSDNLLTETDPDGSTQAWTYDPTFNQVTSYTNQLNQLTVYSIDPATGNVLSADEVVGSTLGGPNDIITNYTYTPIASGQGTLPGGLPVTMTDPLGNVTEYDYYTSGSSLGWLQSMQSAVGTADATTVSFGYNTAGDLTSYTDERGNTTTYQYDDLDRMTKMIGPDPDGAGPEAAPVTSYTYCICGALTSETDPDGNTTIIQHDSRYRTTAIVEPDPDGAGPESAPETTYSYDADGNLLSETDPMGRQTSFTYDADSRMTSETDPAPTVGVPAPVTQYAYNALGEVTSMTDANGNATTYQYDPLGRLTAVLAPLGATSHYTYDAAGEMTGSTDALGNTTTYGYNALDELTSVVAPNPGGGSPATYYTYDKDGDVTSVADALGNTTSYAYDHLQRQTSVTDPDGHTTQFAYDAAGNLTGLTDSDGNTTSYVYDNLNRETSDTNQLGYTESFVYDPAGNVTQSTDRDGRVSEYGYDNLYQPTSETWLAGTSVVDTLHYSYDADGELTSAGDDQSQNTFSYDNQGNLTSTSNASTPNVPAVTLTSGYDAVGNRTSLSATIAGTADFVNDYTYDVLDRMSEVTQQGQAGGNAVADKRVIFGYDADSQLTSQTRYADLAGTQLVANTACTYDATNRLTNIADTGPGATAIDNFAYAYDQADRVTSLTTSPQPSVALATDGLMTYGYDAAGQLTSESSPAASIAYHYDANGNRTSVVTTPAVGPPGTATSTTGTNNELVSDGTYNYVYDHDGNLVTQTTIATGAYTTYTYDYRNRMTSVSSYSSTGVLQTATTYQYDALDRRIGETEVDGSGTTLVDEQFVYDGQDIVLQFNGSGQLTDRYLYGAIVDQVLADEQYAIPSAAPTTAGSVQWALDDMLGSVRDLVDSTGTVIDHFGYDAYGNMSQTNAAVSYLFGYTGFVRDVASGMLLSWSRAYDSADGDWTQEDPIGFAGGQANVEEYVGDDPTNWTDRTGRDYLDNYFPFYSVVIQYELGGLQGILNIANGLQDVGIGTVNSAIDPHGYRELRMLGVPLPAPPQIPSPDWSKGLVTGESPGQHKASKFIGGNSAAFLLSRVPLPVRGAPKPAPCESAPPTAARLPEAVSGVRSAEPSVPAAKAGQPPLQRIHPDSTYAADAEAKASLEYWRTRPNEEIVESLKPGGKDPLITKPDGRMYQGNTRTKVLEERGYDINSLPREVLPQDPIFCD